MSNKKEKEVEAQGHVHGPHCHHEHQHGKAEPIVNDGPRLGRNDPCHCGSLKKFKKCCGQ